MVAAGFSLRLSPAQAEACGYQSLFRYVNCATPIQYPHIFLDTFTLRESQREEKRISRV